MAELALENSANVHVKAECAERRLRIIRLIDRVVVGGPTKHVLYLTAGLGDKFETWLITGLPSLGEVDASADVRSSGVDPIIIPQFKRDLGVNDLVAAAKLARLIWKIKPDIIHTHKSKAGALGRAVAFFYKWFTPSAVLLRPRRCKIVHTYHGHIFHSYYSPMKAKVFLAIERLLARFATDCILVVSSQQLQEIADKFHVGRRRQFHIVPLGLDFDQLSSQPGRLRARLSIGNGEAVVGAAGRLCEIKNHKLLIDAASVLSKKSPSMVPRFIVAGEGHLGPELQRFAYQCGLAEMFVFPGLCRDMGTFYADVDVVALTSLNEGTPLVLIEAMACGKPVISTDVGGVVDIMGERLETRFGFSIWQHGLLVRSGDAEGFASGIKFLLDEPILRQKMGRSAARFARAKFQKSRLILDIQKLYRRLANDVA